MCDPRHYDDLSSNALPAIQLDDDERSSKHRRTSTSSNAAEDPVPYNEFPRRRMSILKVPSSTATSPLIFSGSTNGGVQQQKRVQFVAESENEIHYIPAVHRSRWHRGLWGLLFPTTETLTLTMCLVALYGGLACLLGWLWAH